MWSKAEDSELGFEEAMSWLPSHVIDEACDAKAKVMQQQQNFRHHHHYRSKLTAEQLELKSCRRPPLRPRSPVYWASGGPGMQAIFLDSGQRSFGTGVFLPRNAHTSCQPTKKPACSPVLLPSRVIQALNLNVHKLGLQITPKDIKDHANMGDCNSVKNNRSRDVSTKYYVKSQSQNYSVEIFLPKEWTY